MGVVDKFKDLIGIEEIDEDDLLDEAPAERRQVESRPSYSRPLKEKVVPMQRNTSPMKLMVIDPEGFEECPKLVDSLKARKPVIINLERLETETARKIFDFLSGATYALNGTVQKVANNIFIFAPENVDISSSANESKSFEFNSASKDWR